MFVCKITWVDFDLNASIITFNDKVKEAQTTTYKSSSKVVHHKYDQITHLKANYKCFARPNKHTICYTGTAKKSIFWKFHLLFIVFMSKLFELDRKVSFFVFLYNLSETAHNWITKGRRSWILPLSAAIHVYNNYVRHRYCIWVCS